VNVSGEAQLVVHHEAVDLKQKDGNVSDWARRAISLKPGYQAGAAKSSANSCFDKIGAR
jgi:hypothetical protein